MNSIISALAMLATALAPICRPVPDRVELRYRRPLGQVAEYRLSLQVEGEQISLEERRPVHMRVELKLSEEVIAQEVGGVLWLRVHARPVEVQDPTGTFNGAAGRWPELQVRVTPRGEVLGISLAAGEPAPGPLERAFSSLVAQAAPVVLPACGAAAVGEEWKWEQAGAVQKNRLLAIEGKADQTMARIASTGRAPLQLEEGSQPLGLRTHLRGEQTYASQLYLLLAQGVAARQQGEMRLRTRSEVTLDLPVRLRRTGPVARSPAAIPVGEADLGTEGTEEFTLQSDLRVLFHLELVSVR